MFYETDFEKHVELVLRVSSRGDSRGTEEAGAAYTRAANAVSGITDATYHVLGSFAPVLVKIAIVAVSLLAYSRMLGLVYLGSLSIPLLMTLLFNRRLRVLQHSQYSVLGQVSGAGMRAISEGESSEAREQYRGIMRTRKRILISLVNRSQLYTYAREAVLVGSQFLVVVLALSMRQQIGMTPGDFAKVIGYTTQVAAAFITAASCLDAIISHGRAYQIFAAAFAPGEV